MATIRNTFNGGTASTVITVGNSGGSSGAACSTVNGSPTFDNTHVYSGALAAKLPASNSTPSGLIWSVGSGSAMWLRVYLYIESLPPSNVNLMMAMDSFNAWAGRVVLSTTGALLLRDSTSADAGSTTATVPTGQWVRVELMVVQSTTVGQVGVRLYTTPEAASPTEEEISPSAFNTGGNALVSAQVRGQTSVDPGSAYYLWIDSFGASTDTWVGSDLVALSPTGIASGGAFGIPTLAAGPVTVTAAGIASGAVVPSPALVPESVVIPTGVGSGEAFGTPALAAGSITVSPTGIPSRAAVGKPMFFTATFTPPTVEEGPVAEGPLFSRYKLRRGISVVKWPDGSYSSVRYPAQTDLESALAVYLGGHVYVLNATEVSELTAAGYGDYITFG